MKNIAVRVPTDINVQKQIARLLGSIDDKIEENERINNNLAPHPCKAQIAS
jgi:type I restriction enzyme S subunit